MSRWNIVDIFKNLIDASENLGTIEIEHKKIHEGEGFNANKELLDEQVLGVGDSLWVTGVTKDLPVHLKTRRIRFDKSRCRVTIYEDVEFDETSENLVEVPTYAMNRLNVRDSDFTLYNSNLVPDISNAAEIGKFTLLGIQDLQGSKVAGSPASEDNALEYIYKPNSKYALKIENIGTSDIDFMSVYWFWYLAGR